MEEEEKERLLYKNLNQYPDQFKLIKKKHINFN